jgi:serine/threonine protein kinase
VIPTSCTRLLLVFNKHHIDQHHFGNVLHSSASSTTLVVGAKRAVAMDLEQVAVNAADSVADAVLSPQVFTTPEFICIVMEIARGGDLLRYTLKHYPVASQEEQARWIFQQLIIGLDYCHRRVTPLSQTPPQSSALLQQQLSWSSHEQCLEEDGTVRERFNGELSCRSPCFLRSSAGGAYRGIHRIFPMAQGVANRDLKLENLLMDQDVNGKKPLLKICDFGYSKHEMNSSAKSGVGTPIFMAPEIVFSGKTYDAKVAPTHHRSRPAVVAVSRMKQKFSVYRLTGVRRLPSIG